MIPKECKRLAEVDFPIAVVSKHSAREKSIRHGHPSTLHLWWARRPLAACRSMLMALLLPDPCDEHCPADFKEKARALLPELVGEVGPKDIDLRKSLLRFIGDFANWDHSNHPKYLEVSRGLVKAAHPEETPLVVDPFAGGGSIPLEALRIGCDAFASDLNPVACLILKVMLEDIPRYGPKLAEELRKVGAEIKKQAEKELAEFYPKDPDGATPIAYLWARTARCESPNCGAEIPLMRSFWLSKKAKRRKALRHKIIRPDGKSPQVEFEIFKPNTESEVRSGTITRVRATCLACGSVLQPERVRAQLTAQSGGGDVTFDRYGARVGGAMILAVVTVKDGEQGRSYRLPNSEDYKACLIAQHRLIQIEAERKHDRKERFSPTPDEEIDKWHHDVNRMPMYGMNKWGDLFTSRQKIALLHFSQIIARRWEAGSTQRELLELIALALSKRADYGSSCTKWHLTFEKTTCTFGRQAIPMSWDFVEPTPLGDSSGSFGAGLDTVYSSVDSLLSVVTRPGEATSADAVNHPLGNDASHVWFTDPPYYDSIDYAHCSDFFFVWLKRALPGHQILADRFKPQNPLTPKDQEIVVDSTTTKGHGLRTPEFYESSMGKAFSEGRRVLSGDGIGSVVFAHKTTEGWEALLSGLSSGGWTITSSWPIATERPGRLRSQESAALATSVHLVCRPRDTHASIGDWGIVLRELPNQVGTWMERLQSEGIRGADLVFACIGPSLELFSRYSRVETADGREVKLAEYLEKVWEVVGRTALEQVLGTDEAKARNGAAGALEEDARLTALFLWTLQSTSDNNGNGSEQDDDSEPEDDDEDAGPKSQPKGFSLIFDVVRRFAQPLGIELPKWEDRIIKTEKGVVRLLPVSERAKQLFGEDGARAVADWIVSDPVKNLQQVLFPDEQFAQAPKIRGRAGRSSAARQGKIELDPAALDTDRKHEATTLDRVHAAMLLQAGGQTNALRALLKAEQDRGPDFLRLANALSALYPTGSEEKRLLDAMLLAVGR